METTEKMPNTNKRGKNDAEQHLSDFLLKHRIAVLVTTGVVIAAVLGFCIGLAVKQNVSEKGIAEIDTISYTLTNKSSDLSEADLDTRRNKAMTDLASYTGKNGIVGVRANMLAADIAFEQKKYDDARKYWTAAAEKGAKSYTAPLAYFNAAVCSEELNDTDNAITYYQKAADTEDFYEATHALFSVGRVKEEKQDYKGAAEAYQKLHDKNPDDTWAELAMSRIIALRNEGKIE